MQPSLPIKFDMPDIDSGDRREARATLDLGVGMNMGWILWNHNETHSASLLSSGLSMHAYESLSASKQSKSANHDTSFRCHCDSRLSESDRPATSRST